MYLILLKSRIEKKSLGEPSIQARERACTTEIFITKCSGSSTRETPSTSSQPRQHDFHSPFRVGIIRVVDRSTGFRRFRDRSVPIPGTIDRIFRYASIYDFPLLISVTYIPCECISALAIITISLVQFRSSDSVELRVSTEYLLANRHSGNAFFLFHGSDNDNRLLRKFVDLVVNISMLIWDFTWFFGGYLSKSFTRRGRL